MKKVLYKLIRSVHIFSFAHFVIDFACAYIVFHTLSLDRMWWLSILVYNFCAFALQMPIGLLADKLNRNVTVVLLGFAFVIASYLPFIPFLLLAILAGTGNALFHIGGGIEVMNASKGRASTLGIFVSPGAFGIYFGGMLGREKSIPIYWVLGVLIILSFIILLHNAIKRNTFVTENPPVDFDFVLPNNRGEEGDNHNEFYKGLLMIVGLMIVVGLRSYMGIALTFPWKSTYAFGILYICGVVFGKAFGGIFSDTFGRKNTITISLLFAAIFFSMAQHPLFGVMAIFLFNMTMPITLHIISQILPNAKGFAFGILTFALFLGYLPYYLNKIPITHVGIASIITVVSLLILLCYCKGEKNVS
ncbi:MFS transporter [Lachnoclostridium phytofermentans]|uniref:Major facilitator superfamily MFS_1 n=1 Tax=Lachnoclostridium phytofermentans (strain ATCC 700394 / DSM 18823 / ISDg) TaxID=357809 RepID=A9KLN1_LACP7|nr:MFS transporter [Lachnoclostridium phytofermentans]ABX42775.1 hypothetical protein Cphy_2414 [Lachnoclostridium phytofermentans ISDg]